MCYADRETRYKTSDVRSVDTFPLCDQFPAFPSFCDSAQEGEELAGLNTRRAKLGTKLVAKGMELEIAAE